MGSAKRMSGIVLENDFAPLATMPARLPASKRKAYRALAARADRQPLAAIKLKCLECCGWERAEAKACSIYGCALWATSRKTFAREPVPAEAECEVEP